MIIGDSALYRGYQFYWWRKVQIPAKTTDLPQVNDKLYHIILHRVRSPLSELELTTLVVIGTDCIDSCKSNYHKITTTTVPQSDLLARMVSLDLSNVSMLFLLYLG